MIVCVMMMHITTTHLLIRIETPPRLKVIAGDVHVGWEVNRPWELEKRVVYREIRCWVENLGEFGADEAI